MRSVPGEGGGVQLAHPRRCRRPLVNGRTQYPDSHVTYPSPDSGVVCVVEITAAFWVRYEHAYFHLHECGIKIGRGGEEQ